MTDESSTAASVISETSSWDTVIARLRHLTVGEYSILGELGRGRMAATLLAHEHAVSRKVALKVMSPALMMGSGMAERFRQEARTQAGLSHPNILAVHGVRQRDELHFLVRQYVRGRSLEQVLSTCRAEGRLLPVPIVRALLYQVGAAVAFAHGKGVIHRDIKPANILLNADGETAVTDFGTATAATDPSQADTEPIVIGTPAYMSPEQCYVAEQTPASDQYALGVVAYELLTGRQPFTGSTFAVMRAHALEPVPPIAPLRPDCPPDLHAAVQRMLAKKMDDRFPSVAAALSALSATPTPHDRKDPIRRALIELAGVPREHAREVAAAPQVFIELFDVLRSRGFRVGVDQVMRVQQLLDGVGGQCHPGELKTLLCPILATTAADQEQFYTIFDQLYGARFLDIHFGAPLIGVGEIWPTLMPASDLSSPLRIPRRRRRFISASAVATIVAVGGLYLSSILTRPMRSRIDPPSPPRIDSVAPKVDSVAPPTSDSVAPPVSVVPPVARPARNPDAGINRGLWLALVLAPLVVFAADEARRYRRRQLALRRERTAKPPFVWPLRLPRAPNPYEQERAIPGTARALRRREIARYAVDLDVERSIAATIGALGFPSVRYAHASATPEYLLLIERTAQRDHHAAMWTRLGEALEREGVAITNFFFDTDPRVCYRRLGDEGVLLSELRRRYPAHRLLIFGTGDGFIEPISGRLRSWVPAMLSWPQRALFTTEPRTRWSEREIELAIHFVVLPATVEAMRELRQVFDGTISPLVDRARRLEVSGASGVPNESQNLHSVTGALRTELGEGAYQWLCACALYPELQWDLTLHLGRLDGARSGAINEESLLRLLRLPWFRDGKIPDEIRVALLADLNPALAHSARSAIIAFLERNPPPPNARATSEYELDLALHRFALNPGDQTQRRRLLRQVDRSRRARLERDHVMIRLLEDGPSPPGAMLVPSRLRKLLYRQVVPVFSRRVLWRVSSAIVASLLIGMTVPRKVDRMLSVSIARVGNANLRLGDTLRLEADVAGVGTSEPSALRWTTSNQRVASVDASGLVTAHDTGDATIRAMYGEAHDTVSLRVNPTATLAVDSPSVVAPSLEAATIRSALAGAQESRSSTTVRGTDSALHVPTLGPLPLVELTLASLIVETPNDAHVFVNGSDVSTGSWRADTLRPGNYHLIVMLDDIAQCRTAEVSQSVRLQAGETTKLSLTPRACGTLAITGPPTGTTLEITAIGGSYRHAATHPLDGVLVLPVGEYALTATNADCDTHDQEIGIGARQAVRIDLALRCGDEATMRTPERDGIRSDVDKPVRVLWMPQAEYPEPLRQSSMTGVVHASWIVGTDGKADSGSIRILRSNDVWFDTSVRRAILSARFSPAMKDGRPVRQRVQQSFTFQISDRARVRRPR